MRKQIIAANWKMNKDLDEGIKLVLSILQKIPTESRDDRIGVICPPYIHLNHIREMIKDKSHVSMGAQNCHWEASGAFTGEVSVEMLQSVGAEFVIIGHSERREYFKETAEQLARKTDLALARQIMPIFCCGENLEDRKSGRHQSTVELQIKDSLFHLSKDQISQVVLAYEPVWAIGSGETATPEQAGEMHAFIRKLLTTKYSDAIANDISILYGGSVKPGNAEAIFADENVDGGLIGGASLMAEDFVAIYKSI